jgi:tetratricopeptide (TPR) repeat protein
MNDLLESIAAQLRHYTLEEAVALVCDFVGELDQEQQARFLNLVAQGPRPLVAEAMGLDDVEDLLDEIQFLNDAIANGVYVEYGAGYDAEYGEYRGFGDDSWIDEMDDLFGAATSLFRAGQFKAAADAYIALMSIFDLNEDGFHFTRPRPSEALHTDIDAIKESLFIAVGRGYPSAASKAIEVSSDLYYYGQNRYALLDAWQGREELRAALEAALIVRCRQPVSQEPHVYSTSHAADLLREFYRRYRTLSDYESLCRQIGVQQGWPYEDLVKACLEQKDWERASNWAEDGLEKLPADSRYRPHLQEAQGQALARLGRPAEALDEFQALFQRRRTAAIYLELRGAARTVGRWETLYPQLATEMRECALSINRQTGYAVGDLMVAALLGYAYLLEGDWQKAVEWALNPSMPAGWRDDDLIGVVAAGLLRMGLAALGEQPDDVLAQALRDAPEIIREHGERLQQVARHLSAVPLLDNTVRLYKRLIERAIGGKDRSHYAQAGLYCTILRSIRRLQGREADFERYYQGLFSTFSRYSALKDELRKAIEGPSYHRRR